MEGKSHRTNDRRVDVRRKWLCHETYNNASIQDRGRCYVTEIFPRSFAESRSKFSFSLGRIIEEMSVFVDENFRRWAGSKFLINISSNGKID